MKRNQNTYKQGRTTRTLALALTLTAGTAYADVIDFESLPDDTPAVGVPITNRFSAPANGGVTFRIEGSANDLFLGGYGGHREGWNSSYGTDALEPGLDWPYSFGDFFLAHPSADAPGNDLEDVLIQYTQPTMALGFDLMDIDSDEVWTVTVYDDGLEVIRGTRYANFRISAPVPAPGSLALVGLGGLALIRRRR